MKNKITRTTFKSFIKKEIANLYIKRVSSFDSMIDCVAPELDQFNKTEATEIKEEATYTFGIAGIWLVGHGGDYFQEYENETFKGIEVSNCCGSFIVAIKKINTKII